jgi:DNA-directed RNA polymerase subunit RPC12/RpoP
MFTMVMNFPTDPALTAQRPRTCPYCHSSILQRWGRCSKSILDLHTRKMVIHRYRCTECERTFRSYPPGIDRVSRSRRIRTLAAITWALGLSLNSVVAVFRDLGIDLSRTTVWRDGQALAPYLRPKDPTRAVTFLGSGGIPGQYNFQRDEVTLILRVGEVNLTIGIFDEDGPYSARNWLEFLAGEIGLEVTVSASPKMMLN